MANTKQLARVAVWRCTSPNGGLKALPLTMCARRLYGLNLSAEGWNWVHAALFSSMVAVTDAVAGEQFGSVVFCVHLLLHAAVRAVDATGSANA